MSKHLCDLVLDTVRAGIPDLARLEKKTWCTFARAGRSNGLYVRHGSRTITLWPRWDFSDAEDLHQAAADAGLETGARQHVEDTWAKRYPVPIKVRRDTDVEAVKHLLVYAISRVAAVDPRTAYRGLRFAPEIVTQPAYPEGSKYTVVVNAYERNLSARLACISHYGTRCTVCGFDFKERYGEIGEGFIHVHHLLPLSSLGQQYKIDPKQDLRPVCPNCHEMIHRKKPPYSIEELKQIMQSQVSSH
jgi:hypothetical protein